MVYRYDLRGRKKLTKASASQWIKFFRDGMKEGEKAGTLFNMIFDKSSSLPAPADGDTVSCKKCNGFIIQGSRTSEARAKHVTPKNTNVPEEL